MKEDEPIGFEKNILILEKIIDGIELGMAKIINPFEKRFDRV